MRDDWSDRFESLLVGGRWATGACDAAFVGVIVGIIPASRLSVPLWVGGFVGGALFGVGMFVLLRALDAEESRNQA